MLREYCNLWIKIRKGSIDSKCCSEPTKFVLILLGQVLNMLCMTKNETHNRFHICSPSIKLSKNWISEQNARPWEFDLISINHHFFIKGQAEWNVTPFISSSQTLMRTWETWRHTPEMWELSSPFLALLVYVGRGPAALFKQHRVYLIKQVLYSFGSLLVKFL